MITRLINVCSEKEKCIFRKRKKKNVYSEKEKRKLYIHQKKNNVYSEKEKKILV